MSEVLRNGEVFKAITGKDATFITLPEEGTMNGWTVLDFARVLVERLRGLHADAGETAQFKAGFDTAMAKVANEVSLLAVRVQRGELDDELRESAAGRDGR